MKYYAVIDTNVIVSALLKEFSNPWYILQLVINEEIIPIYSKEIMAEYNEVLTRNKFGFSSKAIKDTLSIIEDFGEEMDPIDIKEKFIDKEDIKFYQIVMSSRQIFESYLVTGNIKHFPKKEYVVTPAEMLEIIKTSNT